MKLDGHRWKEHAKHFGLSGSLPGIVVEDRDNNKNYVFPESSTVSAAALKQHFQSFLDGSLQPTLKSQPEPEDNNGPVKIIVGTNFDKIAMDNSKDVFVEFYAPWSETTQQHAQQLSFRLFFSRHTVPNFSPLSSLF